MEDFSGSLRLLTGERLLFHRTDVRPNIRRTAKGRYCHYPSSVSEMVDFYPEAGWGTMYFTDRRIVFLRKPDFAQLQEVYGSEGMPNGVRKKASAVISQEGMEFLEIRHADVSRCSMGRRTARLTLRDVAESDYTLELSRKDFDQLRPLLERKFVPVDHIRLTASRKSVFAAGCIAVEAFLAIGGSVYDCALCWSFAIVAGLVFLGLFTWSEGFKPNLKKVKKDKWGQQRLAFLAAVMAFAIGVTTGVLGVVTFILSGDAMGLLTFLMITGFMFALCYAALLECRRRNMNLRYIQYTYRCPNCSGLLTRRDITCSRCGSPVWWLSLIWLRARFDARNPAWGDETASIGRYR